MGVLWLSLQGFWLDLESDTLHMFWGKGSGVLDMNRFWMARYPFALDSDHDHGYMRDYDYDVSSPSISVLSFIVDIRITSIFFTVILARCDYAHLLLLALSSQVQQ